MLRIRTFAVPLVVIASALAGASVSCGGTQTPAANPQPESSGGEKTDSPKSTSKIDLPGSCVDPVSDGDKHDSARPFDKHVQVDDETADLDGDGFPDVIVEPAWSCGETCNRSAYVMRGQCGHYVGTFPSQQRWEALEEKHHGLVDIMAHPSNFDDNNDKQCWQAVWQYDGSAYKRVKHRQCECKTEGAKCVKDWDSD
jgi:hypothetical protein